MAGGVFVLFTKEGLPRAKKEYIGLREKHFRASSRLESNKDITRALRMVKYKTLRKKECLLVVGQAWLLLTSQCLLRRRSGSLLRMPHARLSGQSRTAAVEISTAGVLREIFFWSLSSVTLNSVFLCHCRERGGEGNFRLGDEVRSTLLYLLVPPFRDGSRN